MWEVRRVIARSLFTLVSAWSGLSDWRGMGKTTSPGPAWSSVEFLQNIDEKILIKKAQSHSDNAAIHISFFQRELKKLSVDKLKYDHNAGIDDKFSVVLKRPKKEEIASGSDITLKCQVNGNPTPTIYWYRNKYR
ncbi:tyrosine-protein kinase-like 7 [Elysia marginata]|uniref:Tyrosine-protein kinase-like 7 n=1 Tax=Elysia marginata TaxID=1093978 RepID=A0AAV4JSG2_9GAST|nr:tyrosine-protein kinase-like 7 [Elysia marginata]